MRIRIIIYNILYEKLKCAQKGTIYSGRDVKCQS
jgi:hypothetical protein